MRESGGGGYRGEAFEQHFVVSGVGDRGGLEWFC